MDTSKLVRCERHGTFYNPEKFDSCAICRSGTEGTPEGLRFSPFSIAGALVLVLGVFFVLGKAARAVSDRGTEIAAAAADEIRLDPEDYRHALQAVEELVYTDRPRQFGHGSALMQAAYDLSQQIRENQSGGMLAQTRRQQYGLEVLTFGQRQVASEDIGYATFDLTRAQSDWEEVRETVFRDVDWFQGGDLGETTPAATGGPTMSESTVQLLRDLATSLENAARFGRQQAMRIAEPIGDPRSAEMRRVQQAWDSFRRSMNTRLSAAVSGLPEGGTWVSNDAGIAHGYLEQAAQSLASLVRQPTVPPQSMRESVFTGADRNIREAKRLLAGL